MAPPHPRSFHLPQAGVGAGAVCLQRPGRAQSWAGILHLESKERNGSLESWSQAPSSSPWQKRPTGAAGGAGFSTAPCGCRSLREGEGEHGASSDQSLTPPGSAFLLGCVSLPEELPLEALLCPFCRLTNLPSSLKQAGPPRRCRAALARPRWGQQGLERSGRVGPRRRSYSAASATGAASTKDKKWQLGDTRSCRESPGS